MNFYRYIWVMKDTLNVNKFISDSGICSRREADRLIEQGRVLINGAKATLGQRVSPGDEVVVDGQRIQTKVQRVYMAFNKPEGLTSTTDPKDPTSLVRHIDYHERIFPIGRLDKDSTGLILLTNDGNIVNKILRAGNAHEKEYVVKVNKPITPEFVQRMSDGVPILGTKTLPCQVFQTGRSSFRIILVQGLNRQIRRMSEALGYKVVELQRIRVMNISLGNLKPGRWRLLAPAEMAELQKAIAKSVNAESASRRVKEPGPEGASGKPKRNWAEERAALRKPTPTTRVKKRGGSSETAPSRPGKKSASPGTTAAKNAPKAPKRPTTPKTSRPTGRKAGTAATQTAKPGVPRKTRSPKKG